ncbi:hypothetical protein [Burkholderia oklahomensis]|nr:hypothetical protein [Burkholderia oklahomensis]
MLDLVLIVLLVLILPGRL